MCLFAETIENIDGLSKPGIGEGMAILIRLKAKFLEETLSHTQLACSPDSRYTLINIPDLTCGIPRDMLVPTEDGNTGAKEDKFGCLSITTVELEGDSWEKVERYLVQMKATIDCLRQENLEILKMNKEIIQDNARLKQDNNNLTIELKEKTKECGYIRVKSAEDKNNSKVEMDDLKLEVKRLKESARKSSARHVVIKDLSIELEKNGRALKDAKFKAVQNEKENINLVKENSKLKDDLAKLQNEVVRNLSIEIKLKSKTLNDLKLEMAAEGKSENATLMDEMEGYITPSTRGIIIGEFNPLSFNYLLIYGMYMKTSSFSFFKNVFEFFYYLFHILT